MTNPLVSIVIPVFNVKAYCRRCFDSLVEINYPNKEIILVDDKSTDGSGDICDEYKNLSPEIKVIHQQQNGGVTMARITGVEHAQGDYIMFVDSDDYVDPNIVSKMTDSLISNNADLVCCQNWNVFKNVISQQKRSIFGIYNRNEIEVLISKNLLYDYDLKKSGIPLYLWGKIFKRDILSESLIKGFGIKYEEDILSVIDMLVNKVNKLVVLKEPYYYYTHHDAQVTSKKLWEIYPSLLKVWESLDKIGTNNWNNQLSQRIWMMLKPSIYDKQSDWGGIKRNNKFIETFHDLRNSDVVKKYVWNNKHLPKNIKKHPHYILLKYKLYWLDYALYYMIWIIKK